MRTFKKAYLEITNVCNLSCAFCPGTRREKGSLTPGQFQILAQRLRPHTEYLYLHLMGEPLLHPQLGELLRRAEELAFQVVVTTNGTPLPQTGGFLCDSPAVRKVNVSLHSFEGNEGGGGPSGVSGGLRALRGDGRGGRETLRVAPVESGRRDHRGGQHPE